MVVCVCRYVNTAACKSAISFIDGDKGILRYRGYPIEQLAEKSHFSEVRFTIPNHFAVWCELANATSVLSPHMSCPVD